MGEALFLAVVGGLVGTGILLHSGHPLLAVGVALAACAMARWVWVNYA